MKSAAPVSRKFTMAFQPIVDVSDGHSLYAYEALVRGPAGESAHSVLSSVPAEELVAFDAACRERAVEMAASFGMRCRLSLNVTPHAICDYRFGLHSTLNVAKRVGWPAGRLIFELTESVPVRDLNKLTRWIAAARNRGVTVAMDDFGAGYSGINTLLRLRPGMVKLDREIVRGIDADRARQALVKGVIEACNGFNCKVVGEGVETRDECAALASLGIELMQGYFFARPGVARLPEIVRTTSVAIGGAGASHHRSSTQAWRGAHRDPNGLHPDIH